MFEHVVEKCAQCQYNESIEMPRVFRPYAIKEIMNAYKLDEKERERVLFIYPLITQTACCKIT